jgi:hypothetical protein
MRHDGLLSRFILLAVLAAGVLPYGARAAVVYDGFGYPPGADLSGQNGGVGWSGAWFNQGGAQTVTTAAGLSFGNLAVTPGAATTPVDNGIVSTYPRFFADPLGADGTTLYLSFLLRPESDFGFYGGLNLGGYFVGKSGPVATYSLEGGALNNIESSSVVAQAGTTVLLVLKVRFQGGDDIFDLFVGPVPGTAEPLVADAHMTNANLNLAAPNNSLYINNPGGWTIDEIRVGPTFADVTPAAVPAPFSPLLIALGLVAVGLARRRAKGWL